MAAAAAADDDTLGNSSGNDDGAAPIGNCGVVGSCGDNNGGSAVTEFVDVEIEEVIPEGNDDIALVEPVFPVVVVVVVVVVEALGL
jgi:hypothetical protein